MRSRGHPATLRAEHRGPPVQPSAIVATLGHPPRMTERFEEIGEAFAWAVANRLAKELTIVEGHGKRWRYASPLARYRAKSTWTPA